MDIVIVTADPVSTAVLTGHVEKLLKCCVHSFTQASDALAWCKQNDPDLIIISYMMPQINGIEFTRIVRSLKGKADTPMLMVTSSVDREVRSRALESGINDFLTKPFDFAELQVRVNNMLALRSAQKDLANRRASLLAQKVCAGAMNAAAGRRDDTVRLLDMKVSVARFGGDETLLNEVARVFARTAPQLISSIGTALTWNDLNLAAEEAHSLKSAVAAFEAPDVFNALVYVERHAKSHDAETTAVAFAVAKALVERLLTELHPVVQQTAGRETRG
jgi:DNA-binding response OmpR family regulator